jgi:hypothetical protein
MYEIILTESYAPVSGRPYQSEKVVSIQPTREDARRYALMCNTKAFSNEYYSYREKVNQK